MADERNSWQKSYDAQFYRANGCQDELTLAETRVKNLHALTAQLRGQLEATERHCQILSELSAGAGAQLEQANSRYDALLDKLLDMKLQGYAVLPAKIRPVVPEPEDRHMKRQGPDVVDPWIESIVAEGFTREEALAARKQVVADFNSGEG